MAALGPGSRPAWHPYPGDCSRLRLAGRAVGDRALGGRDRRDRGADRHLGCWYEKTPSGDTEPGNRPQPGDAAAAPIRTGAGRIEARVADEGSSEITERKKHMVRSAELMVR